MNHYILDTRTASAHFPGIGRYVRNLSSALIPLLAADEQLTLLCDPGSGVSSPPGATTCSVSVSPFSISQQWRIPLLLRRLQVEGPALYHSPYFMMPYRTGLPTVLTFYDVTPPSGIRRLFR